MGNGVTPLFTAAGARRVVHDC